MAVKPVRSRLLWMVLLAVTIAGCGGRLIPRDLKDYVSAELQTERRRVEFQQPFRSTITLRVNPMSIEEARQAERDLIRTTLDYFKRDGVTDFINDTLVYVVRLDSDPDVNLRYTTVADDQRMLIRGDLTIEEFIDRCRRVDNWSPDM